MAFETSSLSTAVIGVSIYPGATAFTVIFARGNLARQRPCKPDQARFRRRVVHLAGLPGASHHAGNVYDAPPAVFQHRAQQRLRQQESARQVDAQHQVPVRGLHAQHQVVARDAGVVYDDFDFAEFLDDRLGASLDRLLARHVDGERRGIDTLTLHLGHRLGQLGLIHIRQHDDGAGRGQFLRNRAPDSLRPARDQSNSSLQISPFRRLTSLRAHRIGPRLSTAHYRWTTSRERRRTAVRGRLQRVCLYRAPRC